MNTKVVTVTTDNHGNGWDYLGFPPQATFLVVAGLENPVAAGGYPVIPKVGQGADSTGEFVVVTEGPVSGSVRVQVLYEV